MASPLPVWVARAAGRALRWNGGAARWAALAQGSEREAERQADSGGPSYAKGGPVVAWLAGAAREEPGK